MENSRLKPFLLLPNLLTIPFFLLQQFFPEITELLALKPRSLVGAIGILTFPFLHGSWQHLLGNLTFNIVLFYILIELLQEDFPKFFFSLWLGGGALLWLFGRPAMHIGASGWTFGFSFFLLFLGIFARNRRFWVFPFVILVLQGAGIFTGILPLQEHISWDGHLYYAIVGAALAYDFRKKFREQELPDNEPFRFGDIWDYKKHLKEQK